MAFQMLFHQKNWSSLQNTSIIYAREAPLASSQEADIFLARKDHAKNTSRPLVLKMYKNNNRPSRIIQGLIGLHFTNIVSFFQVQQQDVPFCLMEFCYKNLREHKFNSNVDIQREQILTISREVLNGMIELKQLRIIHGDIKPQNLLMSVQEITKLCDLDFSVTEKEASEKYLRIGTFEYMAPEVLLKGKLSYKSDIWSFAVIVFELYFGKHPFPKLHLLTVQGEESFREAYNIISRQIQQVRATIIKSKENSQDQTNLQIMTILLSSLCLSPEQRKGLEELSAIANRNQRCRKMSDFTNRDNFEQQSSPLYHDRVLLSIFQNLLSDIKSLPKGDIIQKKSKELEANLQRLINCMQRQTQITKYDIEVLLQKFTIQLRKISNIIQNNMKRLGGGVQSMRNYEERLLLRQHLEMASSFLSRQKHIQKILVKGFHSAIQLSQRK